MSSEAYDCAATAATARGGRYAFLRLEPWAVRLFLWLVVPLAIASLLSVAVELQHTDKSLRFLAHYNTSFGLGAQAAVDVGRVWHGRGWDDDSWVPMLNALQYLHGGGNALYETLFFNEKLKFQYPPTSLLPLEVLGMLMHLTSGVMNIINSMVMLANVALTALLAWLVFSPAYSHYAAAQADADAGAYDPRIMALAAAGAIWLFYPLTRAFQLGQIQLWIDLAFAAACALWLLDRKTAAGVAISLICAIKPQLGLLLLWALVCKEWAFVRGFLYAAVPIGAVSLALYGWHNHITYLDVLSYVARHGESFVANNSVNGIMNRLLFNGSNLVFDIKTFAPYHPVVHAVTLVSGILLMLIPFASVLLRRNRTANIYDFGAAALCFTAASPIAWEHHYGIMLPLFVLALGFALLEAPATWRRPILVLLAGSWLLSAGRFPAFNLLSDTYLNILQSHLFLGALTLLGLLLVAAHHRAGAAEGEAALRTA